MRFLRKLSIVVVTLGLLATAGPALASETDYTLAPGLRLHVINWHGSQVRVLSMNLKYGRRIRAVPAGPMLPALQYPSRLASDAGALAGVSSDFMMAGPSNQFGAFPAHMLVIGREIWAGKPPYCQTRKWAGCLVSRPAYGVERIHMYATVVV